MSRSSSIYSKNIYSIYYLDSKERMFINDSDYDRFMRIMGLNYTLINYIAYCLDQKLFGLIVEQPSPQGISQFIHDLVVEYNDYFFDRYRVEDILSEGKFIIRKISKDLIGETIKVHKLTRDWRNSQHSSIRAYLYYDSPHWFNGNCKKIGCRSPLDYLNLAKEAKIDV